MFCDLAPSIPCKAILTVQSRLQDNTRREIPYAPLSKTHSVGLLFCGICFPVHRLYDRGRPACAGIR